jgi:N-formylglutamate amidohydrolase
MKFLNLLDNTVIEINNTVEIIESDLSCIISIPHSSSLVPLKYKENRKWDKNILKDTDLYTKQIFNLDIGTKIIGKCNPYFINYSRPKESTDKSRGIIAWEFLDGSDISAKNYSNAQIDEILVEYDNYHDTLQKYIDMAIKDKGYAIIIDGHGMTKEPIKGSVIGNEGTRADFCFGTLDNKTIPNKTKEKIIEFMDNSNYTYSFNNPYKGGYITQKYSNQENVYIIQIETVKENYYENEFPFNIKEDKLKQFKSEILKIVKIIIKDIK